MVARCCYLLVLLLWPLLLNAEPLRVMVPSFVGPEPLSQQVRTTAFLELVKAFQAHDAPERGAWILYGQQPLEEASHRSVVNAASWPSVRADLAIWGQVHHFSEGAVLELALSLTPLLDKRQVRPELWRLNLTGVRGALQVKKRLPAESYRFEPLVLGKEAIVRFENPEGMAIYSTRQDGRQIGTLGEISRFYQIYDDAMLISTGGLKGWLRTRPLSETGSEAFDFSKGMVRLLRGDLAGARQSFSAVLDTPRLPQRLRAHSLIYLGLARELAGLSGRDQFETAYRLNRLDKDAASYLLMSRLADISRLQRSGNASIDVKVRDFRQLLDKLQVLYAKDDSWFDDLRQVADQLN